MAWESENMCFILTRNTYWKYLMFNLFEFIFFAFHFPILPKADFNSHWLGLSLQAKQGPGPALRSDTGYPCQPWLWTWPSSSLSMPGHGLGLWAGVPPLKFPWQAGWKPECKPWYAQTGTKPGSVLVLISFIHYGFWTTLASLLLERMIKGT